MSSIGLYAGGSMTIITKDSPAEKEFNVSVTHKDSPQDQNKLMITVTFKEKYKMPYKVSLINSGKNVELTTVVKDGMVSVTFEIEKSNVDTGNLDISIPTLAEMIPCPPIFLLYLKGYVA
jgi:hypothetical protein